MSVLVTGGNGLVGKYLQEIRPEWIYVDSKSYDLTSQKEASLLIVQERPKWVIHLAAKVGGILDNEKFPNDYYEENMLINTNILRACRINGVKNFTGIDSPYEAPDHPEIHLRTALYSPEAAAEQIMSQLREAGMLYPADELSGL